MSDKELLYEKIVKISEQKENIIKENENLKAQLNEALLKIEYYEKQEEIDFIGKLTRLIECIGVDENGEIKVVEEMFGQKSQETLLAKYFVKAILNKARSMNLDAKKIAEEIMMRIK